MKPTPGASASVADMPPIEMRGTFDWGRVSRRPVPHQARSQDKGAITKSACAWWADTSRGRTQARDCSTHQDQPIARGRAVVVRETDATGNVVERERRTTVNSS
jgi:hypothetical protein